MHKMNTCYQIGFVELCDLYLKKTLDHATPPFQTFCATLQP